MVNGKMFPKVFFILSENDEDLVCFSVTPAIMVLSVGDLLVTTCLATISVKVEVAKPWPCSTGVDSLASFLSLPPVHIFPGSHSWPDPDGPPLLA